MNLNGMMIQGREKIENVKTADFSTSRHEEKMEKVLLL